MKPSDHALGKWFRFRLVVDLCRKFFTVSVATSRQFDFPCLKMFEDDPGGFYLWLGGGSTVSFCSWAKVVAARRMTANRERCRIGKLMFSPL